MKCLRTCILSVIPRYISAIGVFLLGYTAYSAIAHKDLMKQVLKIQEQAKEIKYAVEMLRYEVKKKYAYSVVQESKGKRIRDPQELEKFLNVLPEVPFGYAGLVASEKDIPKIISAGYQVYITKEDLPNAFSLLSDPKLSDFEKAKRLSDMLKISQPKNGQ